MSYAPGYTILVVNDCYLELHLSNHAKPPSSDRDVYMQMMHDLVSRAGVIQVPCLSISAQRLVVYLGVLEKSCFLPRYLSWETLVFVDVSMEIVHG